MKGTLAIIGVVSVGVAGLWWYVADQKAQEQAMMQEKAMMEKQAAEKGKMEKEAMEKEVMAKNEEGTMMKQEDTVMEKKMDPSTMAK